MDGRPQALDALDWPICATAVRMILQGPFSRDTPRRGINRPALVGRRRGVSRARRRKAAPARVRSRARSNPSGRKKGRNLALLETAEGQGFGCVLDGVHAASGGDGADDGARCDAGVGLDKAGVFVALAPPGGASGIAVPAKIAEKVRRAPRRRHSRFGEPKASPGFPGEVSSAGFSRQWVCGRGTR